MKSAIRARGITEQGGGGSLEWLRNLVDGLEKILPC
jgi:hypothetical protein